MKKYFLVFVILFAFASAKAQFEIEGRVFHDSTQNQLKEVYHYYLRYTFKIDRTTGDTVINPTPTPIRHGACILYRKDGTTEAIGQYKDGKRTGKWLFYDPKGKTVIREEIF